MAFCPHPPLIVPAVAAGAAAELDDLRRACDTAVGDLLGAGVDRIALVGPGPVTGPLPEDAAGTLEPYGVDLVIDPPVDGPARPVAALPLSLTIGSWLLARSGWSGPVSRLALAGDVAPERVRQEAAGLSGTAERTGLLVLADGSSTRTTKAPGSWQPGALAFDAEVGAALGSGDPARLAAVDRATAREVGAQGAASWGLAALLTAGRSWQARLYYEDAPYGVGYLVAAWT